VQLDGKGNLIPLNASIFDEIAHPPFQLVMTQDDGSFIGATEITNSVCYQYP
jgi:hypothetical protein